MRQRPPAPPAELASFLECLPEARIVLDLDYRIVAANRAYRDTYADGASPVGRRCYEVSHGFTQPCDRVGESCPRRAALISGDTERVLHVHQTPRGAEHVQVELSPLRDSKGRQRLFVECMESLPTSRAASSAQGLVGRSRPFVAMLERIARVAATDTSVLLLGETGTGKEMVARSLHATSLRSRAPFVAVDCSGFAETLFESELFGHEKGAFTGALARKTGLVETAAGGTLFLDEVGDIPLGLQVKLLRLIETGTFRRVGSIEPLQADFRLVAATHRDLEQMVREERFRADLYYRISAFPVRLPPLRERRDDIELLAESLIARLQPNRRLRLTPAAKTLLQSLDFPGNVRELRNLLERACLLCDGERIEPRHLALEPRPGSAAGTRAASQHAAPGTLRDAERRTLERAIAGHGGSRRELATALGISERTLYRRLREFGLSG